MDLWEIGREDGRWLELVPYKVQWGIFVLGIQIFAIVAPFRFEIENTNVKSSDVLLASYGVFEDPVRGTRFRLVIMKKWCIGTSI